MTLDTYGHLWPDETERLVERMDQAHEAAIAARSRAAVGLSGVVPFPAQRPVATPRGERVAADSPPPSGGPS